MHIPRPQSLEKKEKEMKNDEEGEKEKERESYMSRLINFLATSDDGDATARLFKAALKLSPLAHTTVYQHQLIN